MALECPHCGSGLPPSMGHRDRLSATFFGTLPNLELLELILFAAVPQVDTKPLAGALLRRFGSLGGVVAASFGELCKVEGVCRTVFFMLRTVREIAFRLGRETIDDRPLFCAWDRVLEYCRLRLAYESTEKLHLLFLDSKNALIADEELQHGTVDHVPVYPREIMKRALELGATALIMVHNHPSGNPTPSDDDVSITRDVIGAAGPLGITVHDHIVIGRQGHASLRTLGLL